MKHQRFTKMRILIVLALFVFSYQRVIVQNVHNDNTCQGKVQQGIFIVPNRCSFIDPNQKIYAIARHKGDSYVQSFKCNENCSTCEINQDFKYSCTPTGRNESIGVYYGMPKPISSTGFFFDLYPGTELCKENAPLFQTSFLIEQRCISNGFLNIKMTGEIPKSQRVGFNQERDGVIVEEFSESDCKGDTTKTYFFPNGKCTDIPYGPGGFQIKVRRSL